MLPILAAVVVLAATPSPAPCMRPNIPAYVVRAEVPDVPAMASQQGIVGTVQVLVSLDQQSRVTRTVIRSSPSAILNAAALVAARHSAFQTEFRDCRPLAADFVYNVEFEDVGGAPTSVDASGTKVMVQGLVPVTIPITAVTVRFEFAADGASADAAESASDAAYQKFLATFTTLSAPLPPIVREYYTVLPARNAGMPAVDGFHAMHGIALTVSPSRPLREIVRAAARAGATSASIAYIPSRNPTDVAAAAAVAMQGAQNGAQAFAKARGQRVGALLASKTLPAMSRAQFQLLLDGREEPIVVPSTMEAVVGVSATFALQR